MDSAGTDLVAVFDGDQGCELPFFERSVAALRVHPSVALVAAAPCFAALPDSADIFDLVRLLFATGRQ